VSWSMYGRSIRPELAPRLQVPSARTRLLVRVIGAAAPFLTSFWLFVLSSALIGSFLLPFGIINEEWERFSSTATHSRIIFEGEYQHVSRASPPARLVVQCRDRLP
jgi:hypothetical protein